MNDTEKEIFECLKLIADKYKSAPSDHDLKRVATRMAKFDQVKLFRFLWNVPKNYPEYPSGFTLERDIRIELGLDKKPGLTKELVERNYQAMLREGTSEAEAKRCKDFMMQLFEEEQNPAPKKEEKKEAPAIIVDDFAIEF
jgi:hypothetical protein